MTDQNLKTIEDRYQLGTYGKLPIAIDRGSGCYVFDSDGQRYLDYYGGHCVASTGHCHPRVVEAVRKQAGELFFYSNAAYSSIRAQASQLLIETCGEPYYQAFYVNSGAEANENAIKLARALTGRTEVISMENAFHGRTYGALSATGIKHHREYLNTPVPGHTILPYDAVADAVSDQTAAVLVEPIQSMGGVFEIPITTLQAIRRACAAHGTLLIFDEIQTGVGRTGEFLFSRKSGIFPELVTLAKGIGSGYPAGILLVTEAISKQVKFGDLGSTFGGSSLACAAIKATLEVIRDEGLTENASKIGSYLKSQLLSLESVEEVRGCGLLLGVRFKNLTAREVQQKLMAAYILAGTSSDPGILRLMPPLTLSQGEADIFLDTVRSL
ncbi:MAG: aminotransferase class III-fold pyridoxal phosphate-dependent enzyme [Acidobacteriota bacterium]|nr:MAG: aminotransferase class III-fold pyridoxal phosphate-dependent enzyme [Acidobacteriota bacterium]